MCKSTGSAFNAQRSLFKRSIEFEKTVRKRPLASKFIRRCIEKVMSLIFGPASPRASNASAIYV